MFEWEEYLQVVTSPLLVTSSHKTDNEGRKEEEEDDGQQEMEEEERDSGTESVAEVKETVLWEEKVTFPSIPCNNQQMVSE